MRTSHALMVFVIAGCGLMKIDHKIIEKSITAGMNAKGVEFKSLDCPADEPLKKDAVFGCTGIDTDGRKLAFKVTELDNKGTVDWKLDGSTVDLPKIKSSIDQKMGSSVDIKCAVKLVILSKTEPYICDATLNGKPQHLTLSLDGTSNEVAWKLTP